MPENYTGFGQFVDIGGFGQFIPIATQDGAQVFTYDPYDVRTFSFLLFSGWRTTRVEERHPAYTGNGQHLYYLLHYR